MGATTSYTYVDTKTHEAEIACIENINVTL